MAGILYIVATPIGNLEDISIRALNVLKEADIIAAEDTRHSKKLLTRYGIKAVLTSYYDQNEKLKEDYLLEQLMLGKNIALVSDGGTPLISDPGYRIVNLCHENNIKVTPIPGPSSLTAFLSVSGLPLQKFTFMGFLHKKKKEISDTFLEIKNTDNINVFFESPRRILKTLKLAKEVLGNVRASLGRELTKLNEEIIYGTLEDIISKLSEKQVIKGEIIFALKTEKSEKTFEKDELKDKIKVFLDKGLSKKDAVKKVTLETGVSKNEIYEISLEL